MASNSVAREIAGERQREQGQPRLRAHRGEVAQIDGERAVADGIGRRETAIEVDAFDERVDAQHFETVSRRLHNRRIVTDADDEPRGRLREPCLNPRDRARIRRGRKRSPHFA